MALCQRYDQMPCHMQIGLGPPLDMTLLRTCLETLQAYACFLPEIVRSKWF